MIKFQRWFCTPKSRILVPQNSAPLHEQNPVKWSGEACFWFCYSCNDKARLAHDFARLCLRHSVKNTHHKPPSRFWRRTSCDFEFCSALSHLVTLAMILLELAFSPAKSRIQNPQNHESTLKINHLQQLALKRWSQSWFWILDFAVWYGHSS